MQISTVLDNVFAESPQQAMRLVYIFKIWNLESCERAFRNAIGIENRRAHADVPIAAETSFDVPDGIIMRRMERAGSSFLSKPALRSVGGHYLKFVGGR